MGKTSIRGLSNGNEVKDDKLRMRVTWFWGIFRFYLNISLGSYILTHSHQNLK